MLDHHKHIPDKSGGFSGYLFLFAITSIFLLFINVLIASITFLVGGHVVPVVGWISIILTIAFAFTASRAAFKHYVAAGFLVLLGVAAVFTASIIVAEHIYDISYDGQTYQQEAVIQLAGGWNPVYTYLDPAVIGADQKWIDYYPKSIWINQATIYQLTDNEQAGKALNLIFVVIAFALVYVALIDAGIVEAGTAVIVGLLLVLNPVNLYQWLSFYVDGALISLFLCLVALAFIVRYKKRSHALAALFFIIPLFLNIKFTSVVDALAVLAIFIVAMVRAEDTALAGRSIFTVFAAGMVGIVLMGASPYITNTVRYRTPFYPLEGAGSIDLKPFNVPGNFIDKNSAEIMFLSIFSTPGQARGAGATSTYQLPFLYNAANLTAFRYPDPEEGGFGPLFSGVLLIGLLIMIGYYLLPRGMIDKRAYGEKFWIGTLSIIFVIVLSVVNPISSLARYVPQVYFLAIIPVIVLLSLRKWPATLLAAPIIFLLFFNGYLVANEYVAYNLQGSQEIGTELAVLHAQSQIVPIAIHFNEFKSNRVMFAAAGIHYISVSAADCPNPERLLPENTTEFCSLVQTAPASSTAPVVPKIPVSSENRSGSTSVPGR